MSATTLLKDNEWARIDGQLCLVTEFVPMAKIKGGQSAAVPVAPTGPCSWRPNV